MPPKKIIINNIEIPLILRKTARAKRVSLHMCPISRSVELVCPKRLSQRAALDFLQSKKLWLLKQWNALPDPVPFQPEQTIPILGQNVTIQHIHAARGITRQENDILHVTCLPEFIERRVKDYLRRILHETVTEIALDKAALLQKKPQRISVRDTTSRWGSCTSDGNLSFAYRLVFAPREVIEYVVAHEVAHLVELNHSARFWENVALLHPNYEQCRLWLRQEGSNLYRYGQDSLRVA